MRLTHLTRINYSYSPVLAQPSLTAPTPVRTQKPPTLAKRFITRSAAAGIAINAWYLLGLMHTLVKNPALRERLPFNPRMFTEQAAEHLFRSVRAVLGGENFTLGDFLRRCDRVLAYAMLRVLHNGDFKFPEHAWSWKWDETQKSDLCAAPLPSSITESSLTCAVMEAKWACICDMLTVDIDVAKLTDVHNFDTGVLDELEEDDELQQEAHDAQPAVVAPPAPEAVQIVAVQMSLAQSSIFQFSCRHRRLQVCRSARAKVRRPAARLPPTRYDTRHL